MIKVDPDRTIENFNGVDGNANLGDVAANTIVELELPLVPWAGDLAIADKSLVERGTTMGTNVVDGEKAVFAAKKTDLDFA